MSNKEIAQELGITVRTVKQYIMSVAKRLGCYGDRRFNLRIRVVFLLSEMNHEIALASIGASSVPSVDSPDKHTSRDAYLDRQYQYDGYRL